jgi:DNA polymerase-4
LPEARRWIAHLDMDAFFASVELLKYPELRGEAVVIGGGRLQQPVLQADGTRQFARMRDYVGRGVVTTSTYAARAFGVFSAMGIMKAAKLAPDSILLPADFEAYREYSARFKQAVAQLCPIIQNVGIDEIYVDLTEHGEQAPAMAARLKAAVSEATGLSCSIGLAPNKLLALSRVSCQQYSLQGIRRFLHVQVAHVAISMNIAPCPDFRLGSEGSSRFQFLLGN